jgi:microcystin-dependent protein
MAEPYLGEIRMFAGNFAPMDWAFCNGQLLDIEQNLTLFNLIGTTYGGDGQSTFALPNLQSRIPLHRSSNYALSQMSGVETVTLSTNQLPFHSHTPLANTANANLVSPQGAFWGHAAGGGMPFSTQSPNVTMSPQALQPNGGSQPHENLPPFLVINFIIALVGYFPSQT